MFRLERLPAYVINGLSVSVGIALVHVLVASFGPPETAQPAAAGALYASLPHLVDRAARAARQALVGGMIGSLSALVVFALSPLPAALNLGILALVFLSMMAMAWGPRAGPLTFTTILAIVLSLAAPTRLPLLDGFGWMLLGASGYAVWAYASTLWLERRFRRLALADALETSARLLDSRAAVLEQRAPPEQEPAARWRQIDQETRLASLLQSARDLLLDGSEHQNPSAHADLLLRTIELRDLLLSSRLDLDRLGGDEVAFEIRRRLASSLRANAQALRIVGAALTSGAAAALDRTRSAKQVARILDDRDLPADDPRLRLLPAIASRQQHLLDVIVSIEEQLPALRSDESTLRSDSGGTAADGRWPLRELTRNFSLASPVFRHATRTALAVVAAHALSSALPWATHPHWIVLSVAVVLRGTLAQTVTRRNQRILGTALGCLAVLSLASVAPDAVIAATIWLAAGVAHAFVNVRYTLTAAAATVMALLQTSSLAPITPVTLLERVVDTVIGAGFAWAFSYVLPSWSRRTLPKAVADTLSALRAYAESAVSMAKDAAASQRGARERAYASLEALIAIVRLSSAEPARVRPPLPELVSFIDRAQTLMAQLSSLRMLLRRRAEQLRGPETDQALDAARGRLSKRLEVQIADHSISPPTQPLQLELPSVPAERAAFPWLRRRLDISILEADRAGEAGRAALSLLSESTRATRPADGS